MGREYFMPYEVPDPDGIYPVCLQKLLDIIIKYLTKVFRGPLAMDHIPVPWKDVRVVLIPKPGKEACLTKSYRPISLSSFTLKTLERLLDRFLRDRSQLGILYKNINIYVEQVNQ